MTAYVVVGVIIALAMLIHGVTQDDQADFEAASNAIGWEPASASDDLARDIFDRVNDERAARGLPRLAWHDGLASLAQRWSKEMIATSYRHSDDDFRHHPDFAATGENIAMGYRGSGEVHVAWMESDSHRRAILGADYTAVGIGVVCRNDGAIWATEIFGVAQGVRAAAAPIGGDGPSPIVRRDPGLACDGA